MTGTDPTGATATERKRAAPCRPRFGGSRLPPRPGTATTVVHAGWRNAGWVGGAATVTSARAPSSAAYARAA